MTGTPQELPRPSTSSMRNSRSEGGASCRWTMFFFWAFQKGDLNTHVWIHITFFTRGRWGGLDLADPTNSFFSIWGKARFFSFKCFYSPRNVSINGAARFKSLLVFFWSFFFCPGSKSVPICHLPICAHLFLLGCMSHEVRIKG